MQVMQLRSSGDHRLLEDFPVGASEAGTEYDMVIVDEAHTVYSDPQRTASSRHQVAAAVHGRCFT